MLWVRLSVCRFAPAGCGACDWTRGSRGVRGATAEGDYWRRGGHADSISMTVGTLAGKVSVPVPRAEARTAECHARVQLALFLFSQSPARAPIVHTARGRPHPGLRANRDYVQISSLPTIKPAPPPPPPRLPSHPVPPRRCTLTPLPSFPIHAPPR